MKQATAETLFTAALTKVESTSIRGWAESNRAAWLKIIASGGAHLAGRPVAEDATLLAGYIVATAIGL
jgi:hypothetical protein